MLPVISFHIFSFGLLITSFFLQVIETAKCPDSWLKYQNKCYGIFTEEKPWAEAEVACQNYGNNGHLASFLSAQENVMVAKFTTSNSPDVKGVWIGFHNPKKNGRWRWADLSTTNFRPWKTGNPSNASKAKPCVYMPASEGFLKWVNEDCNVKMSYVCKKK